MKALQKLFRETIIPIKRSIHDCHDNQGTVTLLAANADTWVDYSNNAGAYEYISGATLWDKVNNIANDTILNSSIDIILRTIITTTTSNTMLHVEAYIPVPDTDGKVFGDVGYLGENIQSIGVETVTISKQNVPVQKSVIFNAYVGQYVLDYGIRIRTKLDDTLNSNTNLDNRKLLIRI